MRRLVICLPWVVVVSYAAVIFLSYGEWLDSSLRYKPSAIQMAPEDVLGFGFWVSWVIPLVLFSTSILLVHFSLGKKTVWIWLTTSLFLGLSVADYFLYELLEKQVLG